MRYADIMAALHSSGISQDHPLLRKWSGMTPERVKNYDELEDWCCGVSVTQPAWNRLVSQEYCHKGRGADKFTLIYDLDGYLVHQYSLPADFGFYQKMEYDILEGPADWQRKSYDFPEDANNPDCPLVYSTN